MRSQVYSTFSKRLALFGLVACSVCSLQASAEPSFARMYKADAGYIPSCNACHRDGGGSALNQYGKDWNKAGGNAAAFAAVAELDSDSDGVSNKSEQAAKSNPGDRSSRPGDAGGWLSPLALIPKPIRDHFAGVTAYKPMDTLLTDADISKAQKIGVSLSADDDTTIYLPLENRRPVGMSLIIPLDFKEKRAHMMVVTSGKLEVAKVVAVATPEGVELKNLDRFNGTFAPKVEAPATIASWDDAVAAAVKKAGTLIFVRLKR
ncbi:MAG: hypothetical protein ACI91G_000218 [Gammaproteobacteria bacterium]|jgi:hypothetical protein